MIRCVGTDPPSSPPTLRAQRFIPHGLVRLGRTMQQTDSFIGSNFLTPKFGIITITDCNGLRGTKRRYSYVCSICSKDKELWDLGVNDSVKSVFDRGGTPCGCSKLPKWTEAQYKLRVEREASKNGIQLDWSLSEYKGQKTKISTYCKIHDRLSYTWAGNVLEGKTCRKCGTARGGASRRIGEVDVIKQLMEISYEGYKFIKFTKPYETKKGRAVMQCPDHGEWTADINHLLNTGSGCPGCAKRGFDQTKPGFLYLYSWHGLGHEILKIGITNKMEEFKRIKEQHARNKGMTGELIDVWRWEDGSIARDYETEIKRAVPRFACSSKIMPDGHTETILPMYLPDIYEIMKNESCSLLSEGSFGSFDYRRR